jgi:two-component system response regulator HydG
MPPLRAHPADIPALAEDFLARIAERDGRRAKRLTPEALKPLMDYHWPGNVRELENTLEFAAVTSQDDWIRPSDLPHRLSAGPPAGNGTLAAAVDSTERDLLVAVLGESASSEEAARRLGISRATLWRKMKRLGVSFPK